VASNASPVANQQTLEGAKVAISEGTMMEFLLDSYCEELGMDVSKVQKVSVPSLSLRLEMLLEGKDIDCALLPEPLGDFAVMKGGTPIVDDTKLSTNLSQSVIAVEGSYIKEHKEYVQKFVDAYTEAAEKINSKPEEYRELVMQVANIPEAMRDTYQIPVYSVGQVTDEQLLDRVQDWMVKKGLLEKKGSYEELVDTSFIK
jgi:NitT/TauT family transport system substrate-binding protein